MTSTPSTFFKKQEICINDSNDISWVNDFRERSSFEIIEEMLIGAVTIIFPTLSLLSINLINLYFLSYGRSTDLNLANNQEYLASYFMIYSMYTLFFGIIFILGALKYFDYFFKFDDVINEKNEFHCNVGYIFSRNLIFISNLVLILPTCLISYSILTLFYNDDISKFFLWEIYKCYIIYIPFSYYFMMNIQLNFQVLQNFKKNKLNFYLFFQYIFFYLILCCCLFSLTEFYFNMTGYDFKIDEIGSSLNNTAVDDLSNSINSESMEELIKKDNNYSHVLFNLTMSQVITNFLTFLVSHFLIRENVDCFEKLNINVFKNLSKIKWENFFIFFKEAAKKGILFNFRYFGIGIVIFSSSFINKIYTYPTALLFSIVAYPHLFAFGISKYYKNLLELIVFNWSHHTKKRFLKFFWIIIFSSYIIFYLILYIFEDSIFELFSDGFQKETDLEKDNLLTENEIFNSLVRYYLYFMIFDFISNALEGLLKGLVDFYRNYLSFLKGVLLVVLFIPIGIIYCLTRGIDIFWGYWIGIYSLIFTVPILLFIILIRQHNNSIFPF